MNDSIYFVIRRISDNTYFGGNGSFCKGFNGANIYKDPKQAEKTCKRYSQNWNEIFDILPIEINIIPPSKIEDTFESDPRIRFTPEQVGKMSSIEVRTNYKAIMNSMKYWK